MKKVFLISFIFLIISTIFGILLVINKLYLTIPIIDVIYSFLVSQLSIVFYDYSIDVYAFILISLVVLLTLYVIGYNIAKSNQLMGAIVYIFSLVGFVLISLFVIYYNLISILFNQDITLLTRLMFFILFLPINFSFTLILIPTTIDFSTFLKDLIKVRKVWKKEKPRFEINEEDNITFIDIKTDQHIFTPIPMLIIAQILRKKGISVAWFIKGAFNHLISLIITYLAGWPRARNKLFRFIGMKIGDNCHISQKTIPDPLLPELIEFEDGSGCGIGVKLLTHNVMNVEHSRFAFGYIKVGKNARIGAYSVIMPGVSIGEGSIVGANSTVTKDIPPFCIAYGSPAKVIREFNDKEKNMIDKNF
ncbi:MAG: hypothetical protein GF317_19795 [Candidatus Lokiarchaeota archaeon]|nr:hypothetical protein [Candidatus Lokiarchaeota archaeon]MBD3201738.1 hypothetical protein [Candidatus Lokiarchaeota archaeon]